MLLRNIEKRAYILKGVGVAPLRIFPGDNEVPDDLSAYTKGNPAAVAIIKECTTPIQKELADMEQVKLAKEKNDMMNESYKVLQAQLNVEKQNNEDAVSTIKELQAQLDELKAKLADIDAKEAKAKAKEEKEKAKDKDKDKDKDKADKADK